MVLNLWSTPIFIGELGKDAFGISGLFTLITGYFIVADFYLPFILTQKVAWFKTQGDESKERTMVFTSMVFMLGIGLLAPVILYPVSEWLANDAFSIPKKLIGQAKEAFFWTGFHIAGTFAGNWARGVINGRNKYFLPNLLFALQFVVGVGGGVYLVLQGGTIIDYLAIKTFSVCLFSFLLIVYSIYIFLGSFDLKWFRVKSFLSYLSFPLGNGLIFRVYDFLFSRPEIFIGVMLGTSNLTDFVVCFLITNTLIQLMTKIIEVILPLVSSKTASGDKDALNRLYFAGGNGYAIFNYLLIAPVFLLSGDFMNVWLGDASNETIIRLFDLLIIATLIHSIFARYPAMIIMGQGRFSLLSRYYLIKGTIVFLLSLFFIDSYGLIGAGYAAVSSCIVDFGFYFFISKRVFEVSPVTLLLKTVFFPTLSFLMLVILIDRLSLIPELDSWLALIFAGGLISFFLALVYLISRQIDPFYIDLIKEWNNKDK